MDEFCPSRPGNDSRKEGILVLGFEGGFLVYKGEGRKSSGGKDTEASWVWGRQQPSRADVGGGAGEETGNQVKWVS